jgi:hypothetical protein
MPGIGGLYLDVFAPFLPVIYEFLDCITLSHWSEQIGGLYLTVLAPFFPVIHELQDCFMCPVFLGQQNS